MGHPTDPIMRVATSGTEATGKHYSNTPATAGLVFTSAGEDAVPIWAPGGAGSNAGSIRFAIGTATTQSVMGIPANAVVTATNVTVQTAYSAGAVIEIGRAGAIALLQSSAANAPQIADEYLRPQDVDWGPLALPVVATISGGPAVGAAVVRVDFVLPQP